MKEDSNLKERPIWFKCESCLFGEELKLEFSTQIINCCVENKSVTKPLNGYCSKWKCNNCWKSWNVQPPLELGPNIYISKKQMLEVRYIDHTKCIKVGFE
jgi:hypothetical protein